MPRPLAHVLETYPRDELFQASVAELIRNVRGIVNLYERSQVRLFARRDPFGRFYSCLVYVPRDRYDARVPSAHRDRAARGAARPSGGDAGADLRIHPGAPVRGGARGADPPARVDLAKIERALARAASTWQAGLRDALTATMDEATALESVGALRVGVPGRLHRTGHARRGTG